VRRAGKQKAASRELSTHPPAITSESFIKLYGNRHNPVNFNNLEDFQTRRGELSRGREMTSAPRKRTKRAWQKEQNMHNAVHTLFLPEAQRAGVAPLA
jgi:hypothetical protein